jgi:hypothetical protein
MSAAEQLRLPIGEVLQHLTDDEFEAAIERALAADEPSPVAVPARPCRCEGGPLVDRTDDVLGPMCIRCGRARWVMSTGGHQ